MFHFWNKQNINKNVCLYLQLQVSSRIYHKYNLMYIPQVEQKHLSKILWRKSSLTLKQKEAEEFQKGVVRLTRIWSYSWDPCNTARAILQVPWVDTSTDVFKINRRDTIYVLIFHYILNSLHSNVYNTRLGTTKRK